MCGCVQKNEKAVALAPWVMLATEPIFLPYSRSATLFPPNIINCEKVQSQFFFPYSVLRAYSCSHGTSWTGALCVYVCSPLWWIKRWPGCQEKSVRTLISLHDHSSIILPLFPSPPSSLLPSFYIKLPNHIILLNSSAGNLSPSP